MNPWLERILWASAVALFVFLWNTSESQNHAFAALVMSQTSVMERQTAQLDSILSAYPVESADADARLKQSLMARTDLLGGRFRIFSPDDVRILNDRWAYAQFEDGHFLQAGLFRYEVVEDGTIRWTLIQRMEF
jgi:hypothetical protein